MSYSPPSSAKPFTLNIPDEDIEDWRQLLRLSKLAPETWESSQEDRRYGVTRKWLAETKDYWLNTYSWRDEEKHINSFPNYRMQIDGVDLHFVALFSENKNAVPIQFLHGWPGSFIEFLPMLSLIQKQYPSAKDLPYHIIVPSLPGYTLSTRPTHREFTIDESAAVLNQLMVNLGFSKYITQGGDVGSYNARVLAQNHKECVGIHLNMLTVQDQPDQSKLTDLEKTAIKSARAWRQTGSAYAQEHGTRPSTIGNVLSSSPLALLAWIGEKFLEWSDTDPDLSHILTNISLYWFTSSILTSLQPYRQLHGQSGISFVYIEKPVGFSFFPYELFPGIKHVLDKGANIVTYEQHESGGHFAALEKPKELWSDVEKYVEVVWGKV
ncbi:epoxide hydrolase-like protein [Boeremia exigua]|uniref:epoxide hydrolase-like protein n=1 Tax=Boeremia exigua TaxID=749465 RepID=UPI001E8D9495|nr:epoxide hydrolase-like protein [Boeremia exigua]KAH6643082.1 epoxide hydrolase-like protein [Boeremia exigua]